jgi:DNA-nicking Smr family endonuclease
MAKKLEPEDFSFRPFRNLRKTIDTAQTKLVVKDHAAEAAICPADEDLFQKEMRGVREIEEFRKIRIKQRHIVPNPKPCDSEKEALKILEDISKGRRPIKLEDTQEYVEWVNPAYSPAPIARKLHEGGFAVQDFLDLHGFTVDEAEALVEGFLKSSLLNGLRCVKIIHGRGLKSAHGPVLKESLLGWLSSRYRKNIIAFSTAKPCDGGLGALYILLKRRPVKRK